MKWKQLFKPHILERGMKYYYAGCVEALEADDEQITAVVEGTEDYDVLIHLDRGQVLDMTCTCPYAEGGENCKHMAAVLYAWQQGGSPKPAASKEVQDAYVQLKACVDGADEGLVRRMLTNLLWQDDKARLRFLAEAQPECSPELARQASAMVDGIVDRYMEDGYIDYYEASGFIDELDDILTNEVDTRLEHGKDREAFDISCRVFLALDEVEMDDSDGGITVIANHCQSVWQTILERAEDSLRREIFDWLMAQCGGEIIDYLEDFCEDTLMRCFDAPEALKEILAYEQSALDWAMQRGADKWGYNFPARRYAMNCIRLMERMGASDGAIEDYTRRYWQLEDVRKYYIERRRQAGDWEAVVRALEESIQFADRRGSRAVDYHMQLKDAFAELGWKDEYRKKLWEIVTDIAPADLGVYHEYRDLFDPEDWPKERERLFATLPKGAGLAALYADEGLYDRVLKLVLEADNIYLLRAHETELLKRYPNQVLNMYAREIKRAARNTADRSTYQQWVQTLRHMREMPGGEKVVEEIVAAWRVQYKRRRAMMDELNAL